MNMVIEYTKRYIDGLFSYVYASDHMYSLYGNFPLFMICLFVFAWGVLFYTAVRYTHPVSLLLAASLVFFSPVLARLGWLDYRLGQGIVVFLLSYVAVAAVIMRSHLGTGPQEPSLGSRRIRVTVCILVIVVQLVMSYRQAQAFLKGHSVSVSVDRAGVHQEYADLYTDKNDAVRKVASWLVDVCPDKTVIAGNDKEWNNAVFFFSKGRFRMPVLPFRRFEFTQAGRPLCTNAQPIADKAVFIDVFRPDVQSRLILSVLFAADLQKFLRDRRVRYIMVSPDNAALAGLLRQTGGCKQVYEYAGVCVFEVQEIPETFQSPVTAGRVVRFMAQLAEQRSGVYERVRNNFFFQCLQWDEDMFSRVFAQDGHVVQ